MLARSVILAALLAPGSGLAAQEAPDTTAPVLLPGVTVTVLRAPVELIRAPYAITINGQQEIQRARPGLGLDEALRGVPGVQVDNRYNYALGERISIRGFGARAQFGVRGIRVLVDGVPATFPDGQTALSHVDLGFLRRAEVVRGPASAMYGANAGGVIQLETEAPPAHPLAGELGVTAGADGLLKLSTTTGGRSDRVHYLLNLSRLEYGGYRDFSDAENFQLNGRVGYLDANDDVRLVASAARYDARNPGSLSAELLQADRSQAFANNKRQGTGEEGRHGQLGLSWRRTTGSGEWEVAGYGISREVDNPIPNTIVDLDRGAGGVRALFRSAPLPALAGIRWSAGVDADLQSDARKNFRNMQGERGAVTLDQEERVRNLGAFAQLVGSPSDRLTLLGALRYDGYRYSADDDLVSATNPDDSGTRVMDALSPSVGATFSLAEWANLYGNVATSFETPTTTELANRPDGAGGLNPELQPQTAISYELGLKGQLGARAAYELAAYHSDVENELIAFEVAQAPGRQFFRNAGSATHRGVESSLTLSPLRRALVRATYTYTDARFEEYVAAGQDRGGNQIPGIAPHRADLLLSYGMGSGLFAALETRRSSRIMVNDANTASSPAHTVTDLRAGLERVRVGPLELDPFAGLTNVFDVEYNTSVVINAFGSRFFEPGPGRSFYVGSAARYRVR